MVARFISSLFFNISGQRVLIRLNDWPGSPGQSPQHSTTHESGLFGS
jgi:hypothetical protein